MCRWVILGILIAAFFSSEHAFSASGQLAKPTGSLPRNLADGSFTITFIISDIYRTEITPKDSTKTFFEERVAVKLVDSKNTSLPYKTANSSIENFYITDVSLSEQTSSTGNVDYTYTVTITGIDDTQLSTLVGTKNYVKITVEYNNLSTIQKQENVEITKSNFVADDKPELVSLEATHKALVLNWQEKSLIAGSDNGAQHAYDGMYVVAIEDDRDSFTISKAKKYESSAATDSDASCTFTPHEDECITCDKNVYLLGPASLNTLPGVSAVYTGNKGSITIPGLDPDKTYAVFAFFKPDGIQRSACKFEKPGLNMTSTEFNGEDPATSLDKKCFIVTAAYGSPLHEKVRLFKWFRRVVLLKTGWGRQVVHFYNQNSPQLAEIIESNNYLKVAARILLWVPSELLEGFQYLYLRFYDNPGKL